MTLSLIISCPHNSPYRLHASIQDKNHDPSAHGAKEKWPQADWFRLDPGQCKETFLTSTRRIMLTEELLPENPSDAEKTVTIDERAHGHE